MKKPYPQRVAGGDWLQASQQRGYVVAIREVDVLERLHYAFADATGRHVDHAAQADVVVRVQDEPEIRERILDFLPLVEPNPADDLVFGAGAPQRILERS